MVELLVSLVVLVVLLAIAVPNLRAFTVRNQLAGAQSGINATFALARSEAARRGVPMFLVAVPGAPSGNEFGNGWDVFVDRNGDGVYTSADGPAVRHYDALPASVQLHGATTSVTFTPSGYLKPVNTLSFKVCTPVGGTTGYLLTLPPSGIADVTPLQVSAPSDCTS